MLVSRLAALVALALALGIVSSAPAARGPKKPPNENAAVPGELIVRFKRSTSEEQRDAALAAVGAAEKSKLAKLEAKVVKVPPGNVERALKLLADDPRVLYAEPNYLLHADDTPNDPSFSQLWGLNNTGQTVNGKTGTADADVDAVEAWDTAVSGGPIVVGVIDTGTDFAHPDLGGSMTTSPLMWTNPDEIAGNGVDDDANGYVDDWRGWDFANNDNNPQDDEGHGTHVSGTIGALTNNGVGIAGVSRNVKLMALKFLGADGSGTTEDAVRAILYATAEGAAVTNNSWGGGAPSQALKDAIAEAGRKNSLFVAAAGNSTADNDSAGHWPSNSADPNVISVAATDQNDGLAYFSNFGRHTVDIGAPGTAIYSTVLAGGYDWYDGTSMATPHVAGAAAFLKSRFPAASAVGLKALLFRTADANSALASWTTTGGRMNLDRAARCASAPQVWLEAPLAGFEVASGEAITVSALGAACGDPSAATVTVTANGAFVPLTARGDGVYTGTYTPLSAGTLTFRATATAGTTSDVRELTGTVKDNYRYVEEAFQWIDATSGGTKLSLGDDASATVALPFSFTFYKQPFTSLAVSSNGFVVFGGSAATAYNNVTTPNSVAPNGYAAPFWDDLNPGAGGGVWYRTEGTSPNRKFVVAWVGVPHYSGGDSTFEVILEEGKNDLVYSYKDVLFGNANLDYGTSASVGVENGDGTIGRQFLHKQALLQPYQNATSIRFTANVPADTTPPAAPTALTAAGVAGAVELDWADNTDADLGGYRVYRLEAGTWKLMGTTSGSAYTDTAVTAGTSYTYRVTAIDRAAPTNESTASNEASSAPLADVTAPAAPASLTAVGGDAKVTLDWADNRETDLAGYRVYRLDADAWRLLASTTTSTYADSGLAASTTYSYRVTAYDKSGNESTPAEASATTAAPVTTATLQPTSFTISTGSLYAGGLSSLFYDDASRLQITAGKISGNNYVMDGYATTSLSSAQRTALRSLSVEHDGHASTSGASFTLRIYNWRTAAWQTVDGPRTGVTADRYFTWTNASAPGDYVSSNGEVRFRIRATSSSSFRTRTDLVRFTIES